MPQDQVLGVLASIVGYWDERQNEGEITGYRIYGSTHGDQTGLMIVDGRLETLGALSVRPEGMRLLAKANTVVENLETRIFAGGSVEDATLFFMNGMAAAAEAAAT